MIQVHEVLYGLEQDEASLKEKFDQSKQRHMNGTSFLHSPKLMIVISEVGHHKTLTQELSQARREKQDRLKERLFLAQELSNYQLMYKQICEENLKSEEQAKMLSRKLQTINKERLRFRQECIEHQVNLLKDEFCF